MTTNKNLIKEFLELLLLKLYQKDLLLLKKKSAMKINRLLIHKFLILFPIATEVLILL
jgi:hypothetical protein